MGAKQEARLEAARRIAVEAGQIARRHFDNLESLTVESKSRQDFVSEADREVEAFIKSALKKAFPGDGFLGEETGGDVVEPLWVVDPIDGTTNFLRGLPLFGVSIAWVDEGRCQVGVIYEPATERLFSATDDGPASLNDRVIRVRPCEGLDQAIVAFGYSERSGRQAFLQRFPRVLEDHAEFRRLGAATVGLMALASGQADAFYQHRLDPWDVLAGLLIVERAGGITNDFMANDGMTKGNVCFGAAPGIAGRLAELLEVSIEGRLRDT